MQLERRFSASLPHSRRSGQRGSLRLFFEPRSGKTVLTERYTSAPFGAVRANYPDDSGIPEVQITNPSGGILGGDYLDLEVSLSPGSSATVLTQAANKAYRGTASGQTALFRVAEGAALEYLPHHLIPYAGSSHRQQTAFHLVSDSTLITWDAYAAGRVARGERFAFDSLFNRTSIFRDGVPEAVDGLDLSKGGEPFGGYTYMATAYASAPENLEPLAQKLHDLYAAFPAALASATAPSPNLCVVRLLAHSAPALYKLLNRTRVVMRERLDLPAPEREVI
jgi:urease accessory protein